MPKISKESLRAMKAFTDKIIAAGNINDGRVSEYFYNVWNNNDFPQNVRESAEYVYNIVKTSNYAAFENLTTASNTIQQMLDNPDYPDNDPDAETNSGIITEIFRSFYEKYNELDYAINQFNSRNNYVELGKRGSELRPLMPMINAYMNIDYYYDLFKLQTDKGNLESRVDKLKNDDKELTMMSGFLKHEKEIDPDVRDYKDIKENLLSEERHVHAAQMVLEEHSSQQERELYAQLQKSSITEQQKAYANMQDVAKDVEKSKKEVEKAEEALETIKKGYQEYQKASQDVGKLINRAAESKREYESARAKHEEMQKKVQKAKDLRFEFGLDTPAEQAIPSDLAAQKYYKAKVAGDKWKEAGRLLEEYNKKYNSAIYKNGITLCLLGEEDVGIQAIKKYYKPGDPLYDQMMEAQKAFQPIKDVIPDPEFLNRLLIESGAKKHEQTGKLLSGYNYDKFLVNLNTALAQEEKKAYADVEKEDSFVYYQQFQYLNQMIHDISNSDKDGKRKDELEILKEQRTGCIEKMGNIRYTQIDDIVILEKEAVKAAEIEEAYKEAEKRYIADRDIAADAVKKLDQIKLDQVKKNDVGIRHLQEAVKNGKLLKNDYDIIVEETFKTKDVNLYYKDMLDKAEDNLTQRRKHYDTVKKMYKDYKSEYDSKGRKYHDYSYASFRDRCVKDAGKLQEAQDNCKRIEGRYDLYKAANRKYQDVQTQREELRRDYKKFEGSKAASDSIYKLIENYRIRFSKCRKREHNPVTEGNSAEYNAIWTALRAFGNSKEEFEQFTDEQVREKLTNLATAADNYRIAKEGQKWHIEYFSTDKRYYRLNYANEIYQFCNLEKDLLGTKGWIIPEETKDFINEQNNLIPQYRKNQLDGVDPNEKVEELVKNNPEFYEDLAPRLIVNEEVPTPQKEFEMYLNSQESKEVVEQQLNQIRQVEQYFRTVMSQMDQYRKEGRFLDEMSEENTRKNLENMNWRSVYCLYAFDEIHSFKPGETMAERMQRIQNLMSMEDYNIDQLREDKPENKKFRSVVEFVSKEDPFGFDKSVEKWRGITNNDIRRTMKDYSIGIAKQKMQVKIDEQENLRTEELAQKKVQKGNEKANEKVNEKVVQSQSGLQKK